MFHISCISDFEIQCKHLEKFKSNSATKNRRRKSKVFCMYGTVKLSGPPSQLLRSESYSSAANTKVAGEPSCFLTTRNTFDLGLFVDGTYL